MILHQSCRRFRYQNRTCPSFRLQTRCKVYCIPNSQILPMKLISDHPNDNCTCMNSNSDLKTIDVSTEILLIMVDRLLDIQPGANRPQRIILVRDWSSKEG